MEDELKSTASSRNRSLYSYTYSLFGLTMFLVLLLSLEGCSWISNRRTLFSSEEEKTVPKDQYDQLLAKYEMLLKGRDGEVSDNSSSAAVEKHELVDDLNKIGPGIGDLIETVDVFGGKGLVSNSRQATPYQGQYDQETVTEEMAKLESGRKLVHQNKFDEALKTLKQLEASRIAPIRVQSKFLMGEMLFRQNEYDLSMQIFEEILHKEAFSSLVINSLGRLIVCAEKLKLAKKKEQYFSILHDLFGQGTQEIN